MRTFTVIAIFTLLIGWSYSANAADGKSLYEARCKMCHDVSGKGMPSVAKMMRVNPVLLDITTDKNQKRSDTELAEIVRNGQGKMKGISTDRIADEEIKLVIAHIRKLQQYDK